MSTTRSLLSLLLFSAIIASSYARITLQVEPKMKDCFYSAIDAGQKVKVDFFVVRGGLLDIELNVSNFVQSKFAKSFNFYKFHSSQLFDQNALLTEFRLFHQCTKSFTLDCTSKNLCTNLLQLKVWLKAKHFLNALGGVYQVCFNNEMARWTAKVVTFEVLVGDEINKPVAGVPDQNSKSIPFPRIHFS